MKRIVMVKFSPVGQAYAYEGGDYPYSFREAVLAETGQGLGLAHVAAVRDVEDDEMPEGIMPLLRVATEEDFAADASNRVFAEQARRFCLQRIQACRLDMKLVAVECLFDRSKLIFYFTAPTRVDFRELVKELVREYHVRIELRQIGVRHETQMLGALGSCGMVCCCRRFLHKFVPVTIKMAKEQNLFLNPTKISGICGRLLCCLSFEQENYELFHRSCPRLGKRYQTKEGLMKVLRANMFRNSVAVLTEHGEEKELTLEEWTALEPHRPEAHAQGGGAVPEQGRPAHSPMGSELMVVVAEPEMLEQGVLDEALDDAFEAFAAESEAPANGPAADPETSVAGEGEPAPKQH
ncbi:MAG: hypothetical protein J5828_03725 [Desulfovibrionaceae bacterium]|nr:hypothetical protein [Desulfovibrionaceae bacterium]